MVSATRNREILAGLNRAASATHASVEELMASQIRIAEILDRVSDIHCGLEDLIGIVEKLNPSSTEVTIISDMLAAIGNLSSRAKKSRGV